MLYTLFKANQILSFDIFDNYKSIYSAMVDINTDRKNHKNSAVAFYGDCCAAMFIHHIYFTDNPERSH